MLQPNPPVDIREDDDGYLVELSLEELDAASLRVEVREGTLVIAGRTRHEGVSVPFRRVLLVPADADVAARRIEHGHAALRVFLPKRVWERMAS